ncbi:MAG: hypothetical protein OK456_08390 [Thaumarchaeota archaeon]|nr:hypothetical protein [Nitrososphaerota archaeon]
MSNPSLTDWLTAVGTVGAVAVALFVAFLQNILQYYNRPVLIIEFENEEPFCKHRVLELEDYNPVKTGYYVRLRIRNTGRSIAIDCEGKLNQVLQKVTTNGVSTFRELVDFGTPRALHWSGQGLRNNININGGNAFEYLDVLSVIDDNSYLIRIDSNESEPGTTPAMFSRVDYILAINVYSRNTKPVEKKYQLRFGKVDVQEGKVGYDDIVMEELQK